MQLTVPQRTVANSGSFPVNPDGVADWLKALRPLASESDAREVYRGLKHSNRLQNSLDRRRAVVSCFIPILRELHIQLCELSQAQPLPLTREFSRSAGLAESLLREEAFAFKILLSDSETPLADDARRAMQALARQAESVAHAYRKLPSALIRDAHQLFALAEKHKLLAARQGSDLLTLQDHYRFILLISIADLPQQRTRQLPLVLDFLRSCVADIHIERPSDLNTLSHTDFAIHLKGGSHPEPALSLLSASPDELRWFSVAPVLNRIDKHSARIRSSASATLGSDSLERQSLARLHVALSKARQRRSSRKVTNDIRRVVFGHKEICAHLHYRPAELPNNEESGWVARNVSAQGMCLSNELCRAGLVQVGELISVTEPNTALRSPEAAESSKISALLGVVRWVSAFQVQGISMGIEFLAKSVLPVHITRDNPAPNASDGNTAALSLESGDIGVGESAMIIACKVQNSVLQTVLLPSYLYQSGDRVTATQGGRSRRVQLRKCLQANGLFSQFSLLDNQP